MIIGKNLRTKLEINLKGLKVKKDKIFLNTILQNSELKMM
jgi:hypothetical protein